ncbi:MAG: response regulator [SAR324 cluster bacterium]|nr:response regulator [SAR324 cluster bacterium]
MAIAMGDAKRKILIVDDERANINLLGELLQKDYELSVAMDGREVQNLATQSGLDLILLDIVMPELDGLEACRRLKADPATRHIPVIFITASADANAIGDGFRAGAVDYISKPLNGVEVLARVRTQLELASERERLSQAYQELNEQHERLKMTQSQLLQSEKMASLGVLVAGIAHEINNPTNFVHGGARNLGNLTRSLQEFIYKLAGDELTGEIKRKLDEKFRPLQENLAAIQDGTQRIRDIVQGLRTFSRTDEEDPEFVSVVEGLAATLNLVRSKYKDQLEFIRDFKADPVLRCWPAQLNQVFMNLAINGCQAIIAGSQSEETAPGRLFVSTFVEGENFGIGFRDNGAGMSAEVKKRVFDPFFTTKPVGEGTGLGLSISYGIVEKHGGRIEVESSPGVGSTFTILLPLKTV